MLDRLCGNEGLKAELSAALRAGRLFHGVLLCGADGLGRNFAARLLAADALFPGGGPAAEAVAEGRSSECAEIEPGGPGRQISVDKIRTLRAAMYETSLSASGRAAIIRDAQSLNASSANALLKVLEEPPEGLLILLTANSGSSVLPTIRSRCSVCSLQPLSPGLCARELLSRTKIGQEDAEFLTALYGGALGSCLAAAGDPARMKSARNAADFARSAGSGDRYGMLCAVREFEGRDSRERAVVFLSDLTDVLTSVLEGHPPKGLSGFSPARAAASLESVLEARSRVTANGSPKLILTLLCLRAGQAS